MYFIDFEGLDGSGKSSLLLALEQELKRQNKNWIRTREPGGTPLAEKLRTLITEHSDDAPCARAELLLYEAGRAQHVEKLIRPALASGQWVLTDRFAPSSIAFQAGGRQIAEDQVVWLNQFATSGLEPDLIVLVDLPVEVSRERRLKRAAQTGETEDRIEAEADDFHERVRQGFLKQAKANPEKWFVLDSRETPDVLFQKLVQHLKDKKWLA